MYQNSINFSPLSSYNISGLYAAGSQYQIIQKIEHIAILSNPPFPYGFYTVPAGYKAIISGISIFQDALSNAIKWYVCIDVSGIYYRLSFYSSSVAGTAAFSPPYIFNPGDVIALDCISGDVSQPIIFQFMVQITLIPENYPGTTYLTTDFSSTATLYTLPADTMAYISGTGDPRVDGCGLLSPGAGYTFQNSGGSVTYNTYLVPPAGSPSSANLVTRNVSNNDTGDGVWTNDAIRVNTCLTTAGTTIQLDSSYSTTDDYTQCAYVTMYELPT